MERLWCTNAPKAHRTMSLLCFVLSHCVVSRVWESLFQTFPRSCVAFCFAHLPSQQTPCFHSRRIEDNSESACFHIRSKYKREKMHRVKDIFECLILKTRCLFIALLLPRQSGHLGELRWPSYLVLSKMFPHFLHQLPLSSNIWNRNLNHSTFTLIFQKRTSSQETPQGFTQLFALVSTALKTFSSAPRRARTSERRAVCPAALWTDRFSFFRWLHKTIKTEGQTVLKIANFS